MNTFATPLAHAERNNHARTAVVCRDDRFTYAEFVARCRKLAGALDGLGLTAGDRVAILAGNCHRYLEVYAGVPAAGYVAVPLNTRHAEPEVLYAIEDSGTKVLITDRESGRLADAVETVVRMPDEYDALLESATERELGLGITEESLAGLFYTGGTTGASKGVMLTHRNLVANCFHWLSAFSQTHDDRFLVMAPLFHAAGSNQILSTIWTGGSQILLDTFDPARALDLIEQERATVTLGVPAMLAGCAEEQLVRPRKTDSLRAVAHGGSPIATEVVRRTASAFPSAELIEVYGATELSPLVTLLRNEQHLVDDPLIRSCGQALPGIDIRVIADDGRECSQGEVGEVVVRGPNVMRGYWNKQEQTESVLTEPGYRSGDLGYLDDTGHLYLVDRSKDMIVSGGENVYSTEVEEVLYRHPAVLEAAVFGVPDDRWGEAVHAVVVPREGRAGIDTADLIAFCREHIGGYKVPKAIDLRSEPLPKSGPGKVLKRELRAPFWEGSDRQVG